TNDDGVSLQGRGDKLLWQRNSQFVPLAIGSRFGSYEIVAPLGQGGMGEVYRARDARLDRDVALKVLPGSALADETARAELLREARLVASLNHPHICTIYE